MILSKHQSNADLKSKFLRTLFSPVCFIETKNPENQIDKNIFCSNYLASLKNRNQTNQLIEQFSSNVIKWNPVNKEEEKNISLYFNAELNSKSVANDQHSERVREMIQTLARIGSMKTATI